MITETTVSLTTGVLALLNALARGADGGVLEIHARSEGGLGYESKYPAIPPDGWRHLPPFMFDLLESGWGVKVGAAVRRSPMGEFADLAVAFAVFPLAIEFRPAPNESWKWRRDEAAVADVMRRLGEFSPAPAFIIDAFTGVIGIWPFSEPIRDLDAARRVQRRLAEILGASTGPVSISIPSQTMGGGRIIECPADDPAAFLPLPGSIVRQLGNLRPVVTFTTIAPDRIHSVAEIEAAIGPKGAKQ